jgi:hypothetical protein
MTGLRLTPMEAWIEFCVLGGTTVLEKIEPRVLLNLHRVSAKVQESRREELATAK